MDFYYSFLTAFICFAIAGFFMYALWTIIQRAIKRDHNTVYMNVPLRHSEQYIEKTLDFSKISVPDSGFEAATERQIEHLKNRYKIDIPPDMPKWTASNLITTLHYIEATHSRIHGKNHRNISNSTILQTLSWILSDADMAKHIKRLNQTRFRSGNRFEINNLPTTSKYYKRLEAYMRNL